MNSNAFIFPELFSEKVEASEKTNFDGRRKNAVLRSAQQPQASPQSVQYESHGKYSFLRLMLPKLQNIFCNGTLRYLRLNRKIEYQLCTMIDTYEATGAC